MTSKDKTQDQLLSSIRKNKPAGNKPVRKKAVAKKAVAKQAVRKPAAASSSVGIQGNTPQQAPGIYQSGRRVWPD